MDNIIVKTGASLNPSPEAKRNAALARVNEAFRHANEAIAEAVDAGVTVELERSSRYHNGRGNWGDQYIATAPEARV